MPISRLMQFNLMGAGEETVEDTGKKSSQALPGASSAHFLKLIEERGQVGFWTLDFFTEIATISIGLYRLFGLDAVPLGRDDLLNIIHPEDRPAHDDIFETLRSGHAIDREFRIIRPDGTMRWLQSKAEVIVTADGRPARCVGMMIDVTDQHSARQSVEDGYRYKTLVKSIAAMEFAIRANGEVSHWDGWRELTGQTEAEAAVWGWLEAIHPDDRERSRSTCTSSFTIGDIAPFDHRIRCADGRYRWFLARAASIFNLDGSLREWIGIFIETANIDVGSNHNDQIAKTLAPSHVRAARALFGWTVDDLALKAGVSVSSVSRLETAGITVREHVVQSVRNAFHTHGVSFKSGRGEEVAIHFTGVKPTTGDP